MSAQKEGVGRYRVCVERTSNMSFMSVTLDVSKCSGWLNANASCAESKGSREKRAVYGLRKKVLGAR